MHKQKKSELKDMPVHISLKLQSYVKQKEQESVSLYCKHAAFIRCSRKKHNQFGDSIII